MVVVGFTAGLLKTLAEVVPVIMMVLQLPDSSGNLRFSLQCLLYFIACFAIIGASVVRIVYKGKMEAGQQH